MSLVRRAIHLVDLSLSGYLEKRRYHYQIGYAVAESNDDLKALIGTAPTIPEPGLLLSTRNTKLFRWCLEKGLRVVQPLTLMSWQ